MRSTELTSDETPEDIRINPGPAVLTMDSPAAISLARGAFSAFMDEVLGLRWVPGEGGSRNQSQIVRCHISVEE